MSLPFAPRLASLAEELDARALRSSRIGIEKESLRVSREGCIAQTPHPSGLGSALTHPYITTDYSEALTEIITPPCETITEVLEFLRDTQKFVYDHLEDEILWATSMPCVVHGEQAIPIAWYGRSHAGMMKTVYRRGLGHRYGRVMQVIAGVHFNFSYSDAFWDLYQRLEGDSRPRQEFVSESYFGLIRNLQRVGWLVPYLFGASPAVCKTFFQGKSTTLVEFDPSSYYGPFATSLRMGDIGYQNNQENETGIKANYDSLEAYIASLSCAIETPCPRYERIGVVEQGRYEQLNANILQIENEYYSTVRPKQTPGRYEKPTLALRRRGVRYIELRSLDVNAYHPLGIEEAQLRFLEALLLCCLLRESPRISSEEREAIDYNELATAHAGRDPALRLRRDGQQISVREWGQEILDHMAQACELLDHDDPERPYVSSLQAQLAAVADPELTPSARMLAEMRDRGEGFFDFAKRLSLQHKRYFDALPVNPERERMLSELVQRSGEQQAALEAGDEVPFDEFLRQYFAQR